MELDKFYRVIRFFGFGMIFLSFSWAVFKSSIPSERRPSFAKAVGLYTEGKFQESLKYYDIAVSRINETTEDSITRKDHQLTTQISKDMVTL